MYHLCVFIPFVINENQTNKRSNEQQSRKNEIFALKEREEEVRANLAETGRIYVSVVD